MSCSSTTVAKSSGTCWSADRTSSPDNLAATVTADAAHPVGRLVGDWLVLQPSASGRSRTRVVGFRDEDGAHVGGLHHLALLNHPRVYEHLREWLARAPRAG